MSNQSRAKVQPWECQGFWIRLVAYLLDWIAIILLAPVIGAVIIVADPTGVLHRESTINPDFGFFVRISIPIMAAAYNAAFVGLFGWTPGKLLVGIRVVDEFGNKPGWGRALGRETIGRLLSALFFAFGHLWVAWDKEKRGWHDKIGGTYVVKATRGEANT